MDYRKILVLALGIACLVASQLLPQLALYLMPTGTGLLGWAVPAPGKPKSDS